MFVRIQVSHGFASSCRNPWVQCTVNGHPAELYPLAEGIALISGVSPCYIDYTEMESVLFELDQGQPFNMRVVQRGGIEFVSVNGKGIAYKEYSRLRAILAEKGVTLWEDERRVPGAL